MIALMQQLSEQVMVRPIKTEADYEAALAELDGMVGHVEPGTPDGNRYELLASLAEAFEEANYPIAPSNDPIAMIEFVLEARGLTRKDLEPFIGTRQRVWDIMEKAQTPDFADDSLLGKGTKYSDRSFGTRVHITPLPDRFFVTFSAIGTATLFDLAPHPINHVINSRMRAVKPAASPKPAGHR